MSDYFGADLVLTRGPAAVSERRLTLRVPLDGTPLSIGRAPHNDVVLDPHLLFASQRHCTLFVRPAAGPEALLGAKRSRSPAALELCLVDAHSSNGTFVNGQRAERDAAVALCHGDTIVLGGMRDVAVLPAGSESAAEIAVWRVDLYGTSFEFEATPPVFRRAAGGEKEKEREAGGSEEEERAAALSILRGAAARAIATADTPATLMKETTLGNTNTMEETPANTNAIEGTPANKNAIEGTPANTNAIEGTPANTNTMEETPANKNAIEGTPANKNAIEGTPANKNAMEGTPANTNAIEGTPANTNIMEGTPASMNAGAPATVPRARRPEADAAESPAVVVRLALDATPVRAESTAEPAPRRSGTIAARRSPRRGRSPLLVSQAAPLPAAVPVRAVRVGVHRFDAKRKGRRSATHLLAFTETHWKWTMDNPNAAARRRRAQVPFRCMVPWTSAERILYCVDRRAITMVLRHGTRLPLIDPIILAEGENFVTWQLDIDTTDAFEQLVRNIDGFYAQYKVSTPQIVDKTNFDTHYAPTVKPIL